ncbi:MAG: hypothetical protein AAGF11_09210 [Myxococcota bacterium]
MTTASGDATATADDVEGMLDALFQGTRERFVTERNAAARRLANAGRELDAARVKAVAKPSVCAWAVNQLWWLHRPAMRALLDAARRQALALSSGAGPAEQAAAGQGRRRALDTLLQIVTEVLTAGGHATSTGTMRKISNTLDALAAHGIHPGGPTPGRLTTDLDPPGFELMRALGSGLVAAAPTPEPALWTDRTGDETDPNRAEAEAALAAAVERREAARERAGQAARSLDEATTLADDATLAAQRAALALDEARARALAAAQAAEQAERESLRLAAHARRERQRVDEARRALEGISQELDQLEQTVKRAMQQAERRID